MDALLYLVPIATVLSLMGLAAFFWCLNNKQFDDLDGEAERILFDDDEDHEYVHKSAIKDNKVKKDG